MRNTLIISLSLNIPRRLLNVIPFQASVGMTACDECPEGKFGNETGLKECFNCTVGMYEDETGQTQCVQCPAGNVIWLVVFYEIQGPMVME